MTQIETSYYGFIKETSISELEKFSPAQYFTREEIGAHSSQG